MIFSIRYINVPGKKKYPTGFVLIFLLNRLLTIFPLLVFRLWFLVMLAIVDVLQTWGKFHAEFAEAAEKKEFNINRPPRILRSPREIKYPVIKQ